MESIAHGSSAGVRQAPRRRWSGPTSLGGRVTTTVLALLTVVLLVLFTGVDLALGSRLDADARTRLTERAALARRLGPGLPDQALITRLRGDGITALVCQLGEFDCPVPGRPARGPAGPGGLVGGPGGPGDVVVQSNGALLYTDTRLFGGRVLRLSLDTAGIGTTLRRLILLEVVGGALALLAVALLLWRLSRIALRPLDDMTALARQIAAGDRGRRLGTGDNRSELGRTAAAFDDMLDELETAVLRARAAEARMRDFVGDASHELRTPLTGIAANAENLLRGAGDRVTQEAAALAVVRETRRASRLVESLLDVARLDANAGLDRQRLNLVDLADSELARYRELAPQLRVTLVGVERAQVEVDALRMTQVLVNLLDNARHATGGAGSVQVSITTGNGLVTLTVCDDGPGIAPADRERVFQRFTRLDSSRSRRTGGAGLGLAISRTLVAAHGGRLIAQDRPDGARGACLRIDLPLPGTDPRLPGAGPARSAPASTAQAGTRTTV